MTRLASKASLPAALYVLSSTATAHAECAWGLWAVPTRDGNLVGLESAYRTKQECEAEARRVFNDMSASGNKAGAKDSRLLHPLAAEDDARRRGVGSPLSFPELRGAPGVGFRDGVKFADGSSHALLIFGLHRSRRDALDLHDGPLPLTPCGPKTNQTKSATPTSASGTRGFGSTVCCAKSSASDGARKGGHRLRPSS
jgi:hypothetical protein